MPFLNSEQAALDDERVRVEERVRLTTQMALLQTRNQMLESLLKTYSNRIIDLEIRIALLEAQPEEE
jgi:hypothetical protein